MSSLREKLIIKERASINLIGIEISKMTATNIFNGAGDVVKWAATLTAKLIAKGYRSHILMQIGLLGLMQQALQQLQCGTQTGTRLWEWSCLQ
jgi:hypothetical protein